MLRTATASDRAWARSRYDAIGFLPSNPEDRMWVALDGDGPVAVGRIVPIAPGVGELGGIYVEPAARGRGLAERVVRQILADAEQDTLFCLPFAHLRALYERCGFRSPDPTDPVPPKIAAKLAWCVTTYPDPVLLLRWGR